MLHIGAIVYCMRCGDGSLHVATRMHPRFRTVAYLADALNQQKRARLLRAQKQAQSGTNWTRSKHMEV